MEQETNKEISALDAQTLALFGSSVEASRLHQQTLDKIKEHEKFVGHYPLFFTERDADSRRRDIVRLTQAFNKHGFFPQYNSTVSSFLSQYSKMAVSWPQLCAVLVSTFLYSPFESAGFE